MKRPREKLHARLLLAGVLVLGLGSRCLVGLRGHNFDFDSYLVVAEIVERGGNVYAETARYNYGPMWFNILGVLSHIASVAPTNKDIIFRYMIVGLLSLADIGVFLVLFHQYGRTESLLFFLNPISIVITGYHNQFDNLALLFGLLSVVLFGDDFEKPLNKRKALGLTILGFSLMTKHLLFAFPFWLAVKQRGLLQKILILIIPIAIFIFSFFPYYYEGQYGMINNVLMYKPVDIDFFYRLFVPEIIKHFANGTTVWLFIVAMSAFIFRHRKALDSLLLYTCILVVASPVVASQHLTIPVSFISANPNIFFWSYTIIGTFYVLFTEGELHFPIPYYIDWRVYVSILITVLFCGLIWMICQQNIVALAKRVVLEVRIQLGFKELDLPPYTRAS